MCLYLLCYIYISIFYISIFLNAYFYIEFFVDALGILLYVYDFSQSTGVFTSLSVKYKNITFLYIPLFTYIYNIFILNIFFTYI